MNTDRKNSSWDNLSLKDKADIMRMAVQKGMYNLDAIRNTYNEFAEGGDKNENIYDTPRTFLGRVAQVYGASPKVVRGVDVASSTAQSLPYGYLVGAMDLGYDLNRAYRKEDGAWGDVAVDAVSMLPFLNKLGLKASKTALNAIKGNETLRKAINYTAATGKITDFVNDTTGADRTSDSQNNKHYVVNLWEHNPSEWKQKSYSGPLVKTANRYEEGGPEDVVKRVIREEGFLAKPTNIGDGKMTLGSGLTASKWHKLYNQKGEWTEEDNQKAVAEELEERRKWAEKDVPNWDKLPQDSQNALLSYKYNFDFNRNNSPKLYKALSEGNFEEAARQMDATSNNPKFKKGLQARRQREQEWFLKGLEQVAKEAEAPIEEVAENASVYNPPQSVIDNIIANNGKYMITGTPPMSSTRAALYEGLLKGTFGTYASMIADWARKNHIFEEGGYLMPPANIYDGETEPTQQINRGRRPIITISDGTDVPGYDYFGNQIWTMTDGNKAEDIDYDVNLPNLVVTPQNNLDLAGVVNNGMNETVFNAGRNIRSVLEHPAVMYPSIAVGMALAPIPTLAALAGGVAGGTIGNYADDYAKNKGIENSDYGFAGSLLGGLAGGLVSPKLPYSDLTALEIGKNMIDKYPGFVQYPRYAIGKFKYGFDAKLPTLYRKYQNLPKIKDGKVTVSNPNNRFAYENGYGEESPIITNFTTDAPVRSHSGGNWDRDMVLAFPGETLLGKHVISTRPSDTFTFGDNITVPIKNVTGFSGRPKELEFMKNAGIKAVSAPEAEVFWESGASDLINQIGKYRKSSAASKSKVGINLNRLNEPIPNFSNYEYTLENLTRDTFKNPTFKDYQFMDYVFKPKYSSQIIPEVSELNLSFVNKYPELGEMLDVARMRYLDDLGRWKNVMYDPATTVESQFRREKNIGFKPIK